MWKNPAFIIIIMSIDPKDYIMHKRFYLFEFFLLLWATGPIFLGAQDLLQSSRSSAQSYVFALDDIQVQQLMQKGPYSLGEAAFTHLVDSFLTGQGKPLHLPQGHYLIAHTKNASLHLEYYPVKALQLQVLNDAHSLHLIAYDATGRLLPEAQVQINRRDLAYDPQSQSFAAPRRWRGGLLAVSYQGHTNWFELRRKGADWNFRRTYEWVFSLPTLRLISWRLYRLATLIGSPYQWRYVPRNVWNRLQWQYHNLFQHSPDYRSYIVKNKPIYRPGDTLHAKVVFLDYRNAKPLTDSVFATTRDRNGKAL
ncbi:MAG: hypothetical protein AAGM67_14470, partial [Bacteroidota bacterium]